MRLGVMQPYFLPYLGYFDLILNTDQWIVFDTPQYIRHGWVNRNRILHPNGGWQYIIVPLRRHHHTDAIQDIYVNDDLPWRRTIMGQLTHYRRRAPHYAFVKEFVDDILSEPASSLASLNVGLLARFCNLLSIPFRYRMFSAMNLAFDPPQAPGEWALLIAQALGATTYVNPPGGESLFDRHSFEASGIALEIRHPPLLEYSCRGYAFEPHLSIVDLLMWNRPQEISDFLLRQRKLRDAGNQIETAPGFHAGRID